MEGGQLALITAVAQAAAAKGPNYPWAVVLLHGRPVTFGSNQTALLNSIPALLAAWRPGEEGGNAVVDILLGEANPSAKLAQVCVCVCVCVCVNERKIGLCVFGLLVVHLVSTVLLSCCGHGRLVPFLSLRLHLDLVFVWNYVNGAINATKNECAH